MARCLAQRTGPGPDGSGRLAAMSAHAQFLPGTAAARGEKACSPREGQGAPIRPLLPPNKKRKGKSSLESILMSPKRKPSVLSKSTDLVVSTPGHEARDHCWSARAFLASHLTSGEPHFSWVNELGSSWHPLLSAGRTESKPYSLAT